MPLRFRSLVDLHKAVHASVSSLPSVDLIVGVPRSGLLPAILISDYLNLPLTDVDGLRNGYLLRGSPSMSVRRDLQFVPDEATRILVIDDSVGHGTQIAATRASLSTLELSKTIYYAAVYVTPESRNLVDFAFEELPWGRYFGWNLMHRTSLRNCCLDADGLLWPRHPSVGGDIALPLWKPTKPVGCIVTKRSSHHRAATEQWLMRHQILFDRLVMAASPIRQTSSMSFASEARLKASAYRHFDSQMLISDSYSLSQAIARLSEKPVISVSAQEIILPRFHHRIASSLRNRLSLSA